MPAWQPATWHELLLNLAYCRRCACSWTFSMTTGRFSGSGSWSRCVESRRCGCMYHSLCFECCLHIAIAAIAVSLVLVSQLDVHLQHWLCLQVARMPYMSYISMLHLYESLGWWRVGKLATACAAPCECILHPPVHRWVWRLHCAQ